MSSNITNTHVDIPYPINFLKIDDSRTSGSQIAMIIITIFVCLAVIATIFYLGFKLSRRRLENNKQFSKINSPNNVETNPQNDDLSQPQSKDTLQPQNDIINSGLDYNQKSHMKTYGYGKTYVNDIETSDYKNNLKNENKNVEDNIDMPIHNAYNYGIEDDDNERYINYNQPHSEENKSVDDKDIIFNMV